MNPERFVCVSVIKFDYAAWSTPRAVVIKRDDGFLEILGEHQYPLAAFRPDEWRSAQLFDFEAPGSPIETLKGSEWLCDQKRHAQLATLHQVFGDRQAS